MMNNDTLAPLLALRATMEKAIAGYLDKLAALRKRVDHLNETITMLRASDEELIGDAPEPIRYHSNGHEKPKKVVNFDVEGVEQAIKVALEKRPHTKPELLQLLTGLRLTFSTAGVRRILLTSPAITKTGERNDTLYHLKTSDGIRK